MLNLVIVEWLPTWTIVISSLKCSIPRTFSILLLSHLDQTIMLYAFSTLISWCFVNHLLLFYALYSLSVHAELRIIVLISNSQWNPSLPNTSSSILYFNLTFLLIVGLLRETFTTWTIWKGFNRSNQLFALAAAMICVFALCHGLIKNQQIWVHE